MITIAKASTIFNLLPKPKYSLSRRIFFGLAIHKSILGNFFYSASQGLPCLTCGGALLHFNETHTCRFKMGMDVGTNSYVNLLAPRLLMIYALEVDV